MIVVHAMSHFCVLPYSTHMFTGWDDTADTMLTPAACDNGNFTNLTGATTDKKIAGKGLNFLYLTSSSSLDLI